MDAGVTHYKVFRPLPDDGVTNYNSFFPLLAHGATYYKVSTLFPDDEVAFYKPISHFTVHRSALNKVIICFSASGNAYYNIHLYLSYPPKLSVSDMVKRLKGRSSRMLLSELPEPHRRYWGNHFWGIGYGC